MTTNDIVTERLLIKSTQEKDGEFCLSIWLDDEMGKYLADPPRDKAEPSYLNFSKGIENNTGWYPFIAILKESGVPVGTCSLVPSSDQRQWDLGYCIHKTYWRQGYGYEMIKGIIDYGYSNGGRIFTADIAQENAASNAVLRKLGFSVVKEGTFKKCGTTIVYASYTYQLEMQ